IVGSPAVVPARTDDTIFVGGLRPGQAWRDLRPAYMDRGALSEFSASFFVTRAQSPARRPSTSWKGASRRSTAPRRAELAERWTGVFPPATCAASRVRSS